MLEVENLNVEIQNSEILRNVAFEVAAGELVCLVGRNGAGKTTTLRTIMGYLRPKTGVIRLGGNDLAGLSTLERARLGIGYAPETSEVFAELSVGENIEMPTWTRRTERSADERIGLAYQVFPQLRRYMTRPGTHLSGGERKMLSIARTLALDARLLLLDEPFEGLSPTVIPSIKESIRYRNHPNVQQATQDKVHWFFSLSPAERRDYSDNFYPPLGSGGDPLWFAWPNHMKIFFNNKGVVAKETENCMNYPPNDMSVWDW